MNKNLRLIIGIILSFILILLGASIIKDILMIIFKNSLNNILFQIIHIILIYIFITLFLKTKPVKQLEKEIVSKFKRKNDFKKK
ncbi:MAG: hypothetical protein U9Q99_00980 [Nanoarchaeota archaeon]|nr:hypothetical protein [Nanoarchaeota archaeon]